MHIEFVFEIDDGIRINIADEDNCRGESNRFEENKKKLMTSDSVKQLCPYCCITIQLVDAVST